MKNEEWLTPLGLLLSLVKSEKSRGRGCGHGGLSEEVIDGAVTFAYVVIGACYDGLADVFLCPFG